METASSSLCEHVWRLQAFKTQKPGGTGFMFQGCCAASPPLYATQVWGLFLTLFSKFVFLIGSKTFQILPNQDVNSSHMILSIHRLHQTLISSPPPSLPSFSPPVWRRSSRKISRFTFQRILCCKMDSSSLSLLPLLLVSTLHPHRPPLYFPTAACGVNSGQKIKQLYNSPSLSVCVVCFVN